MLDYQGPIPNMTPTLSIEAIQKMADHSQKWHDGGSKRNQSGSFDGIAAIASKIENLSRDMLKVRETVHAIQVGCEICGGGHLTKNCPHVDEENIEEAKYGENRPFYGDNRNSNGYRGNYNRGPYGERKPSLEEIINKFLESSAQRQKEQDEWLKEFQENTDRNLSKHDTTLKNLDGMRDW